VLAVIPARGGSKGLPGKNTRPFAGLPLIAHSIEFARLCPEVTRAIVSTDSDEIAEVARQCGGEVPFRRPMELARDDTPLWAVLRHALSAVEANDGAYDALILLDPTSPAREPADVSEPLRRLRAAREVDGVVGVSRPDFNPIWHCVVERDGVMANLIEDGARYTRRQDAPMVYRINGSIYVWRAEFVRREPRGWWPHGRHLLHEIPERRAMSIDTLDEFERAEVLVRAGYLRFPWLEARVA
jgi:N-acylneuraminate cytidylyltransferase